MDYTKGGPDDGPAHGPARRVYRWLAAQPDICAALLYSAVALAAFVAAYVGIFTHFASYDDEGTLLTTVKAFVEGDDLYREVYSPYGPFYYELFGGLFALTGWSVTTDASRLIVVVVWVLTSALYGFGAHRLTGRLSLGVSAMLVAFAVLAALVSEPMHPHGLAVLLIAALALLVVFAPGRRVALGGLAVGALLSTLVLTKINLGAFAVAAFALAAVLAIEPLRRRRWIRWPVVLAFLAMPLAVMVRDVGEPWVRDFIILELLASLSLIVAASAARSQSVNGEAQFWRWLTAAVTGAIAMSLAVIGILLVLGLSVTDIYEGVVTEALGIRDAFVIPFILPEAATDWGVTALAAAVIAAWMHQRRAGGPGLWEGVLRVAAGVTIWLTIAGWSPFSFEPEVGHILLPLALAWVCAMPPPGGDKSSSLRFARVFLPALAISQVLQVYPVGGNQQSIAAVTFVPVGALCIADGLRVLQARALAQGQEAMKRFGSIALILTVALAGNFGLDAIIRPGLANIQVYASHRAVELSGASRLRLPPEQAEAYERIVSLLRQYRCSTFVSIPSLNSFYLWSSLSAPKPQLPGPWMRMATDSEQREMVARLRDVDRLCAIRDENTAAMWIQGHDVSGAPLVRYITDSFDPVEDVGGLQFLVRRAQES